MNDYHPASPLSKLHNSSYVVEIHSRASKRSGWDENGGRLITFLKKGSLKDGSIPYHGGCSLSEDVLGHLSAM